MADIYCKQQTSGILFYAARFHFPPIHPTPEKYPYSPLKLLKRLKLF